MLQPKKIQWIICLDYTQMQQSLHLADAIEGRPKAYYVRGATRNLIGAIQKRMHKEEPITVTSFHMDYHQRLVCPILIACANNGMLVRLAVYQSTPIPEALKEHIEILDWTNYAPKQVQVGDQVATITYKPATHVE